MSGLYEKHLMLYVIISIIISAVLFEINNFARTGYYYKKPFEYKHIFDWIIDFSGNAEANFLPSLDKNHLSKGC